MTSDNDGLWDWETTVSRNMQHIGHGIPSQTHNSSAEQFCIKDIHPHHVPKHTVSSRGDNWLQNSDQYFWRAESKLNAESLAKKMYFVSLMNFSSSSASYKRATADNSNKNQEEIAGSPI